MEYYTPGPFLEALDYLYGWVLSSWPIRRSPVSLPLFIFGKLLPLLVADCDLFDVYTAFYPTWIHSEPENTSNVATLSSVQYHCLARTG